MLRFPSKPLRVIEALGFYPAQGTNTKTGSVVDYERRLFLLAPTVVLTHRYIDRLFLSRYPFGNAPMLLSFLDGMSRALQVPLTGLAKKWIGTALIEVLSVTRAIDVGQAEPLLRMAQWSGCAQTRSRDGVLPSSASLTLEV